MPLGRPCEGGYSQPVQTDISQNILNQFRVYTLMAGILHHMLNRFRVETKQSIATNNILKPEQNGWYFAGKIFKCIFFNAKDYIWFQILLQFVARVQITKSALIQVIAWPWTDDKPLPKSMMACATATYMHHQVSMYHFILHTLQWRHNGRDGVSNHQPHDCLLNCQFRRRSKKTPKLCVTGLCVGNSPGTGEFPAQMASNAEYVSIWWHHHDAKRTLPHSKLYSIVEVPHFP